MTRAATLMADVTVLTSSAHSRVAEFTFLTPFARFMWAETTFRFSRGTFVLRATGLLTAGNAEMALIRSVFQCCIASKCWVVPTPPRKRSAIGSEHYPRHRFCLSKPLQIKELRCLTLISGRSFSQVRSVRRSSWKNASRVMRATGFRPLRPSCVSPRRPRGPRVRFALAQSTFVGTARLSHPTLLRADTLCT
uniref:RxLR effector candidate protein n=1 Tax=Hyaloperonospora arabidopsidis (strain Emoy2) TaxID=559515 RepID=M4BGB3_HYAAE